MKTFFLSLLFIATTASAGEIYVSPKGSNNASGSVTAPLKTPQRALRMAREWRRTNDVRAKGGIRIILEGGSIFRLDEPLLLKPEDSGTEDSKTIITSLGAEKAVLSGGMVLNTEERACKEVDRGAKGVMKKIKANLNIQNGATPDMPENTYIIEPTYLAGVPQLARSLWVNGKKRSLATSFGEGVMERIIDFNKTHETITIPAKALKDFGIETIKDAPQLEMVVHQRWAIAILRVKDFYFEGDNAVVSFLNPESRWEFAHPWPQPVTEGERGASSFLLRNARQFLDKEGEWWQDYATGKVYCCNAVGQELVIPYLNRLVTVEGTAQEKVHDIIFENIAFEHCAWQRPSRCGHVTLQGGFAITEAYKLVENEGLPWAAGLENQAWIERPEAAVSIRHGVRVDVKDCLFTHLAATALDYVDGCKDITIEGNMFHDIGGTAILAGTFLEGATEVHRPYGWTTDGRKGVIAPEDYTERVMISRNKVSDVTNEDWGGVGIGCGMVRNTTISDNTVTKVNYCGICIGWGWTPEDTGMRENSITGNIVSDYARQLYDAGGIYTMSNQPNSVITGNTIGAPFVAPYATNYRAFPIYFDACSDGFRVYDNRISVNNVVKEPYGYNNPGKSMVVEQLTDKKK